MLSFFTKQQVIRLGLLLCSFVALPAVAQAQPAAQSHPLAMPGRLVLKLKPEHRDRASAQAIEVPNLQKALTAIGATQISKKFPNAAIPHERQTGWVDLSLVYEVEFTSANTPESAAALLLRSGVLSYAEPLYSHTLLYEPNDPLADSISGPQYYLRKIRAYEAWGVERGDSNVVIGIIDTGTKYDHEDLQHKIKRNYADPVNGIDDDGNGFIDDFTGWDFSNIDNDLTTPTNNGHGVPVSGVAAADADNGMGIAGTGFNSMFLPVKVYPSGITTGVFRGYEGIVYAADRGVKVINLSWGDSIPYSDFQQEIINYAAINKDVAVVAAAGNYHAHLDYYPASYANVLSVAGADSNKVLSTAMTYSYKVDISAPGEGILTTVRNAQKYQPLGGSSFAAPQVAAAIALVRSKWPNFTAQQAAEQVRITADRTVYSLPGNAAYQEQIGRGFLDMYAAVTDTLSPSIRNIARSTDDQTPIYSGDTITLTSDFQNFLRPASPVSVTLSSTSPYVTITDNSSNLGAIGTLAIVNNQADPFVFEVASNAPANEIIRFRLEFIAPNYSDYQYFDIVVNPDYVNMNTGELQVTLSARGTIGYNEQNTRRGRNSTQGLGIVYQNSPSLVYESALIIGTNAARVSDAARSTQSDFNTHFTAQEPMHFIPGVLATQQATGLMADDITDTARVGVEVRFNSYANQLSPHLNYVMLQYLIKNAGTDTLTDLHAGIFSDWDINMFSRNATSYDSLHKLGYAYSLDPGHPMGGIALLTAHEPAALGINNYITNGPVNMADGFSIAEKFFALSNGTTFAGAGHNGGSDIAQVVGGKIGSLAPAQTDTIAFAIVAGHTLAELQAAVDAANANYPPFINSAPGLVVQAQIKVYPVPAATHFTVALANQPESGAALRVLNIAGQTVYQQALHSTETTVPAGQLPAGMYFVQVVSAGSVQIQKMVISK